MRKKSTRKVRNPKACIDNRMPLPIDQLRDLGLAYRISFDAMLHGHGTEQTWGTVACAINIAFMLAEQGVCAYATENIKLAQDALIRSRERAQKFGTWAFDGQGVKDLLAATMSHDDQLETATRGQVVAAFKLMHSRLKEGAIA